MTRSANPASMAAPKIVLNRIANPPFQRTSIQLLA
jgi:hypothetical protein